MVKILNGEAKVDMGVVANDVKDYREGFEAGVKLYAEAVRDVTVRGDLNVLLEKWMVEGHLKLGFEEFVKETIKAQEIGGDIKVFVVFNFDFSTTYRHNWLFAPYRVNSYGGFMCAGAGGI